ncbi:MAG: Fe-S cluster protein [Deltaproteobacteria bacterium RIFCSPLOWO2_02_FULL_50_16]|nr:MAG: Fe-S cluster protein [Deltaproteobacteria bacterium RIFCSPHIGHO2_02_FULL_50_15]OGQ58098.1 MAG: Fe-S cluster protein [Deltaproteobacteria bacterium RIFCSPLOWO2_02_FULL_50_16]OGQ69027.1 MAG: Fe-S cluster protein [Deltaproteobacteria bacterium RIFCSPLOWO2_12_FULL_50_11]
MVALGVLLATILAIANKKLHVFEDPRIDVVEGMLPSANCGACGEPGCRAFAEKVVKGGATPGQCTVSSSDGREDIAHFLGVDVGAQEKRVARLACAGGNNVARQRVEYLGLPTCQAAHLVAGGGKGCVWGCLGLGDCERVCDFGAITMNEWGLPVVDEEKCTACNDCVEVCPKDLFSLHPISHKLWVACKNEVFGEDAEIECEVACTACGRCAADAPEGIIEMKNNLAVIDYSKIEKVTDTCIQRCPTGAIVWLGEKGWVKKGVGAKGIIRKTPLPIG